MYHLPVLLSESVNLLNIHPEGTYVDLTFGGGGHSREILTRLLSGKLVAFDQDDDAASNLIKDDRFTFIPQNFRYLSNFLGFYQLKPVDGILADLGVSSFQIDEPEKGFSHMHPDAELDMRMSRKGKRTAADILNTYSEKQLSQVFYNNSELQYSRKLSAAIVSIRNNKPFRKTADLTSIVDRFISPSSKYSNYSRVFQAIRIEVNEEITALKEMLSQTLEVLKPGGVLVIISYHSDEDRLVKNFMKTGNPEGVPEKDFYGRVTKYFEVLTRKPIIPSIDEIQMNNRARSAKLRAAKKL